MEAETQRNRFFFEFIPVNLIKTAKKGKGKLQASSEIKFALFIGTAFPI